MKKIFPAIILFVSSCVPDGNQMVREIHYELEEVRSESVEVRKRTDSAMHLLEGMGVSTKEVIIKKEIQKDTVVIEKEPERVMMMRSYPMERPRIIRDTVYIYKIDTIYIDMD